MILNEDLPMTDIVLKASQLSELTDLTGNEIIFLSINDRAYRVKTSVLVNLFATITKASLGLDRVDNTADLDKPISNRVRMALDNKANLNHQHTVSDIIDIGDVLDLKANVVHRHNVTDIDGLADLINSLNLGTHTHQIVDITGLTDALLNKADMFHIHSMNDITNLIETLSQKANLNHTHSVPDVEGLNDVLAGKSNVDHSHSIPDVTGLQIALDDKANLTHSHSIPDVTGLQIALDDKAPIGHTHELIETLTYTIGTGGDYLTFNEMNADVTSKYNEKTIDLDLTVISDVTETASVILKDFYSLIIKRSGNFTVSLPEGTVFDISSIYRLHIEHLDAKIVDVPEIYSTQTFVTLSYIDNIRIDELVLTNAYREPTYRPETYDHNLGKNLVTSVQLSIKDIRSDTVCEIGEVEFYDPDNNKIDVTGATVTSTSEEVDFEATKLIDGLIDNPTAFWRSLPVNDINNNPIVLTFTFNTPIDLCKISIINNGSDLYDSNRVFWEMDVKFTGLNAKEETVNSIYIDNVTKGGSTVTDPLDSLLYSPPFVLFEDDSERPTLSINYVDSVTVKTVTINNGECGIKLINSHMRVTSDGSLTVTKASDSVTAIMLTEGSSLTLEKSLTDITTGGISLEGNPYYDRIYINTSRSWSPREATGTCGIKVLNNSSVLINQGNLNVQSVFSAVYVDNMSSFVFKGNTVNTTGCLRAALVVNNSTYIDAGVGDSNYNVKVSGFISKNNSFIELGNKFSSRTVNITLETHTEFLLDPELAAGYSYEPTATSIAMYATMNSHISLIFPKILNFQLPIQVDIFSSITINSALESANGGYSGMNATPRGYEHLVDEGTTSDYSLHIDTGSVYNIASYVKFSKPVLIKEKTYVIGNDSMYKQFGLDYPNLTVAMKDISAKYQPKLKDLNLKIFASYPHTTEPTVIENFDTVTFEQVSTTFYIGVNATLTFRNIKKLIIKEPYLTVAEADYSQSSIPPITEYMSPVLVFDNVDYIEINSISMTTDYIVQDPGNRPLTVSSSSYPAVLFNNVKEAKIAGLTIQSAGRDVRLKLINSNVTTNILGLESSGSSSIPINLAHITDNSTLTVKQSTYGYGNLFSQSSSSLKNNCSFYVTNNSNINILNSAYLNFHSTSDFINLNNNSNATLNADNLSFNGNGTAFSVKDSSTLKIKITGTTNTYISARQIAAVENNSYLEITSPSLTNEASWNNSFNDIAPIGITIKDNSSALISQIRVRGFNTPYKIDGLSKIIFRGNNDPTVVYSADATTSGDYTVKLGRGCLLNKEPNVTFTKPVLEDPIQEW